MTLSPSVLVSFKLFATTSAAHTHTSITEEHSQREGERHTPPPTRIILITRHRHGKQNKSPVMSFQLVVFGAVRLATVVVGALQSINNKSNNSSSSGSSVQGKGVVAE